ncbi:hypothetical protein [Achromobacter marplatensis]|uniref:hypothetical protein n=1 Tax=Achromobacter marplatensis TaxID=470868 RepID=UPI003C777A42
MTAASYVCEWLKTNLQNYSIEQAAGNLRADLNLRMDKSSPKHEVNDDIKNKVFSPLLLVAHSNSLLYMQRELVIRREMTTVEFIDVYCSELRDMLESETKQDHIEINFTATEFNALTEVSCLRPSSYVQCS